MAPPLAALCGLVLANALANVIATPLASEARERDQVGTGPLHHLLFNVSALLEGPADVSRHDR